MTRDLNEVTDALSRGSDDTNAEEVLEQGERGASVNRRKFGAAAVTTTLGLAGCISTGEDTPTQTSTETGTETATEEPTDTPQSSQDFNEIYTGVTNQPWTIENSGEEVTQALRRNQISKYQDPSEFDSFDDMMIQVKDDILNNWTVINDGPELTIHLQHAMHNDLGYSPDEVRILNRDTAGGGTYTAVLHNEDGDWQKDLALPAEGREGYLKHDDTEEDINFNHEAHSFLWNLWNPEDFNAMSSTHYSALVNNGWEDGDEEVITEALNDIDKGNDHIVVGNPYGEVEVGYTVPAAERVESIMNWHENEDFNDEMAMIKEATKVYHNSEEPYIEMQRQNDESTAVPAEEHQGPENLYL